MSTNAASASPPETLKELYKTFITGSHILHYHGLVDAYGHLSARHPKRSDIFIMSRAIPPGTIASPQDLIEYWVKDAGPVEPTGALGYSERCIHSEIYKRYPSISAVIHSHSAAVVPYGFCGVPMKAVYHMAGFLPESTPIYDIADHYQPDDKQDMLVSNARLGAELAKSFGGSPEQADTSVVLMRGHGFTCMAATIEDCVVRAYYTQENARIQTTGLTLRTAYSGSSDGADGAKIPDFKYLSASEREGASQMSIFSCMRPWTMWAREVAAHPLYVNQA